nr:MAG TPA: hypothetical protein [Caudoviricetes sp.]
MTTLVNRNQTSLRGTRYCLERKEKRGIVRVF